VNEADYIVVGAGAAGAVVAARLSEDPGCRVLLIEAGGPARGPLFSVPLLTGLLLRACVANWGYVTEPEPQLGGRRLAWPRGRAFGGSTAINGMVHMRGLASDYDGWAQRGLPGWSHPDVLPAFKALERSAVGDDAHRGRDGPFEVARARAAHPLFAAWLEAAGQAGHRSTDDFNGPAPWGVGTYEFAIRCGRRVSTATAFLRPALRRPNLRVVPRCAVRRIALERGRAVGVVVARDGAEATLRAAREVIVSAGAVGSPQLLMLSGLGPADHLRGHGIAVAADLPGVGANLQDHLLVRVSHRTSASDTIDDLRRLDRAALAVARAWAFGTGPAASFPIEVGGLLGSASGLDTPDLQTAFMPGLSSYTLHLPFVGMKRQRIEGRGFFANLFQMRPESRGEIRLASADPAAHPLIQPNYLSAPRDRDVLRAGIKLLREVFGQPAFDRWRGEELAPGSGVTSDADLDRFVAATADTVFHPAGTCAMGAERDPGAVLDARLRVRGLEGLRVADASVMPRLTSSNTATPTMMIGERCARFIRSGE
jgi:choline dehydrogenase